MIVLKLGGAALKESLASDSLYRTLAKVRAAHAGLPLVIVHGGGPEINATAAKLGLVSSFHEGQRVTTPEFMEIVELVLSGKINPAIVRGCLRAGLPAFGLSGVDGGLFECGPEDERLGQVGHVRRVRVERLESFFATGLVPVVSPVGLFPDFRPCNVNADLAAARLAVDLKATRLLFLTDKDGILDAGGSVMKALQHSELADLYRSPTVSGGMKVKVRAILEVLEANPSCRVEVMNGLSADALEAGLVGAGSGTVIGR